METNTDALGAMMLGLINPIIEDSLKKANFEEQIRAEIAKAVGAIPTTKLEIITPTGHTTTHNLVHKQFRKLVQIVGNTGLPVLLKGEAGNSKSHNAEACATALGLDFYSMSVGEQSTKSDILGFIDAHGNYRTTAFRKAFSEGGLFLLDEVDAGNPNVLLSINTGLSNGFIEFPDGMVKKNSNFRLIATANTFGTGADSQYVGRNKLDLATRKRFVNMTWELDENVETALVANANWLLVLRAARTTAERSLDGVLLGMREAIYGAKLLAGGLSFEDTFQMIVLESLGEDDQMALSEAKKYWVEPAKEAVEAEDDDDFETVEIDPEDMNDEGDYEPAEEEPASYATEFTFS